MKLLENILSSNADAPRLTVYNEATGARMDFSATTLDNWAAKIANMLVEELDLDESSLVVIDLPVSWQTAVIALGAHAARIPYAFEGDNPTAVFTSVENFPHWQDSDVVVVSDDPFGRGVKESGGTLPEDALDFSPTVRFYGDVYYGDAPALSEAIPPAAPERYITTGWTDLSTFTSTVLAPIAGGGSTVVVSGPASEQRLDAIAENEKVTARI